MQKVVVFVGLALIMWSTTTATIQGQGKGQKLEELDYIRGSERGPERWGYLHKEWAACNNGTLQSPIDLSDPRARVVPPTHNLDFLYSPAPATIRNRGHDIELKWAEEGSKIRINNTEYVLRQCHWHAPSEHTINGTRYDMELHLFHQNAKNQIAVIGLLYKLGKPDMFLSKLSGQIRAVWNRSQEIEAGVINPAEVVMGREMSYFRYLGSLTTPPCTQGIIWTVHTKIGTVSYQQIELLRAGVHDHAKENARPVQPRNGRKIQLFNSPNSYVKPH